MFKYLGGAVAAAVLFIAPSQAQAECYGAGFDGINFVACFSAEPGVAGTTVAPTVTVSCTLSTGPIVLAEDPCNPRDFQLGPVSVQQTGFVPNPSFPQPCVDPSGPTVRSSGGTLGTLFVDGVATPVNVPAFFVGNPGGC